MADFRSILAAFRDAARSMPRWALPFYWLSAACILPFAGFIWAIAAFCGSMRPLYERPR